MTGGLGFNFWWGFRFFFLHCVQIGSTASSSMDTWSSFLKLEVLYLTVSCYNYVASTADERNVYVEHWWNDSDRENLHYLGENPVPVPLCPQ
jgi:hypothetical protein